MELIWEIFRTNYDGDLFYTAISAAIFTTFVLAPAMKITGDTKWGVIVVFLWIAVICKLTPEIAQGFYVPVDEWRISMDGVPYKMSGFDFAMQFLMGISLLGAVLTIFRTPPALRKKGGS